MKKTILITGGEGVIGSYLREVLAARYDLRLTTLVPISGVPSTVTDISDLAALRTACTGVESVVHLAATTSGDATWEEALRNNIIGTYNVFEAARQAGVGQVIFASSNHTVAAHEYAHMPQMHLTGLPVLDHLIPPRPDSLYGVSKCFGETLGRFYSDHYAMRVICLRIGSITPLDVPEQEYGPRGTAIWQSKRDFAQLLERCLEAEHISFDIFYGVSRNSNGYLDLEHARQRLGYEPQDSAEVSCCNTSRGNG